MSQHASLRIDLPCAERLAALALANVVREYPNHPQHLWLSAGDALAPSVLHPAFYGSYDWHSAVHMHWLLARLVAREPTLTQRAAIAGVFDRHLAPSAIAGECAYFARPGTATFERTYGWAWLLRLAAALRALGATGATWHAALAPLVAVIVERYRRYLPRADHPLRHGLHANSAFGLMLALDYADDRADVEFATLLRDKALAWFGGDRDVPWRWEPSGTDFLSPSLTEAALMRRVLPARAYGDWLAAFLPALGEAEHAATFAPVRVADRGDAQLAHLDGLNLSRAWCLYDIAPACERRAAIMALADAHFRAGLTGLANDDFGSAHWLASFAMLAADARAAC
jgi:Protein of unknown function (DUF2891)